MSDEPAVADEMVLQEFKQAATLVDDIKADSQKYSPNPINGHGFGPYQIRQDVYDFFEEISLAVKFKRMELEWITAFDITWAANEWGVIFKGNKITYAFARFVLEMFVSNQPFLVGSMVIVPEMRNGLKRFMFVPLVVKDVHVDWDSVLKVVPAVRTEQENGRLNVSDIGPGFKRTNTPHDGFGGKRAFTHVCKNKGRAGSVFLPSGLRSF